jgi:DNA-3-methyladenine glycosylase II
MIATTKPFSFAQALLFVRRFPPCQGDFVLGDDSLTGVVALSGRAVPFTLRGDREVTIETPDARVAPIAADFIGATDDLAGFYAAADGDRAFRPILELLHGLHHVRFLTLAEIAVYSVMMQRTPITIASTYKRRFLAAFGLPHGELRAMPELASLGELDAETIATAIGNRRKAETIVNVVRGVAAIGATTLRDAPYETARDALLAIPGIGPFSAAAILLRGLGRMDETPIQRFADEARAIYGDFDPRAIARRYGRHVGYWSFYLKTGVPRLALRTTRAPARANVRA